MHPFKTNLLATTVVPLALAVTAGMTVAAFTGVIAPRPALSACAPCNPCAAKNPCNPCAAKNPCNPCAAKNPCNPCAAANPCNPCNPCAAGAKTAASSSCFIPRLAKAAANPCNPCAAKNPCNPCAANACNPCAAKNPCNPCAAANPCNPCAVATACNPCAAKNPCNPCAAKNPCNPCAAKNPCNPCAAKNPCNPCAAANPCNPCGAANPCNPCGAGPAVELTNAEAADAYDCVIGQMRMAYGKSGDATAASYTGWRRYSKVSYQSSTHGERYVQNYANATGRAYGAFEKAGVMPVGSILAKDSFGVNGKGSVTVGPMFMMEKMPAGFNADSGNWKYTMIMPNGSVFGVTNAKNSSGMQFCIECHAAVAEEQDHMMFLPEEYRTQ